MYWPFVGFFAESFSKLTIFGGSIKILVFVCVGGWGWVWIVFIIIIILLFI